MTLKYNHLIYSFIIFTEHCYVRVLYVQNAVIGSATRAIGADIFEER